MEKVNSSGVPTVESTQFTPRQRLRRDFLDALGLSLDVALTAAASACLYVQDAPDSCAAIRQAARAYLEDVAAKP